jgi:hypothetical protein
MNQTTIKGIRPFVLLATIAAFGACSDDDPVVLSDSGADAGESDGSSVVDVTTDTTTPDDTEVVDPPDATDVGIELDATEDAEPDTISVGNLTCEGSVELSLQAGTPETLTLAMEGGAIELSVRFTELTLTEGMDISLACGDDDIVPEGMIALSPPFIIGAPVAEFPRRFEVAMPFELDSLPEGAGPQSLRVFFRPQGATRTALPVVLNMQENLRRGTIRFESNLRGTFQVGVDERAGQTYDRRWAFRAITGISMGASGASMIGTRNSERFDLIGPLGGPTDWGYLAHYIREGGMGGFGPAPDFGSDPMVPTQELEHAQAYDNWWFPAGEGTGGSFNRSDYAQIFLDLMLSFGNIVTYNDLSPYAAPGLPLTELGLPASVRCDFTDGCGTNSGVYRIATGYYDDEFNPDGSRPVITFCDGRGSSDRSVPFDRACDLNGDNVPDETNEGAYDAPCAQDRPMDISFAVDLNDNGLRDPGEPIIRNFYEPFEDLGADGLADADEPGYDAVANPDPAFDNYDYAINPGGTEGNWFYDEGEPWEDLGLDGVADTPQLDEGGYDYGEGNGTYDFNPNLADLLFNRNPRHLINSASPEELERLNFFLDAGARDLFNFGVGGNQLMGALAGQGQNVRVYDGFYSLQDLLPEDADDYSFADVNYATLGENVFLRYGSIDASPLEICLGDGKHVGSFIQVANRLLTMLGYMTNRFPDPELSVISAPYPQANGTYFAPSASSGGVQRYSIAFPPGLETTQCSDKIDNDNDGLNDGEDPDCTHALVLSESGDTTINRCNDGVDNDADGRRDDDDADCASGDGSSEWPVGHPMRDAEFPVVFILHGYGQTPDDLQVSAVPFAGFMAQGIWPKAILVFPDGFCGRDEVTECNDGIDNDDDGMIDRADGQCTGGSRTEDGREVTFCNDGIDNDEDGLTDLEDGGCSSSDWDSEANCLRGNFYTDHAAWPDGRDGGPSYEDQFIELMDHIDANYPARAPEVFDEVRQ